nr:MAG TPA: hypothetical protein [Caudoviricetes sp.]
MWGCTKGMQVCLRSNRLTLLPDVRRKRTNCVLN